MKPYATYLWRYLSLFFIPVLTLCCSSCNKELLERPWAQIDLPSHSYRSDNLWAAGIGAKVYLGNESNSGQYSQFFVEYDIFENTFTDLPTNEEVCACGYSSYFITHNANLYYIANEAVEYIPSQNKWTGFSSTYNDPYRRGEAGVAAVDDEIFLVGGRNNLNTLVRYDFFNDTWSLGPDFPYYTSYSAAVGYNGKLYVFSGSGEGTKKVSVFNPDTDQWKALNDAPSDITDRCYAVAFNSTIYLTTSDKIFIYDPATDSWGQKYGLPKVYYKPIPVVCDDGIYLAGFNDDSNELVLYKFLK